MSCDVSGLKAATNGDLLPVQLCLRAIPILGEAVAVLRIFVWIGQGGSTRWSADPGYDDDTRRPDHADRSSTGRKAPLPERATRRQPLMTHAHGLAAQPGRRSGEPLSRPTSFGGRRSGVVSHAIRDPDPIVFEPETSASPAPRRRRCCSRDTSPRPSGPPHPRSAGNQGRWTWHIEAWSPLHGTGYASTRGAPRRASPEPPIRRALNPGYGGIILPGTRKAPQTKGGRAVDPLPRRTKRSRNQNRALRIDGRRRRSPLHHRRRIARHRGHRVHVERVRDGLAQSVDNRRQIVARNEITAVGVAQMAG